MRILVYGINYAPELTGIGKYTTEMCEWLEKEGFKINVITGFPYYPNWEVFEGYKGKLWHSETINGVKIHRCPLYIPSKITGVSRILHEMSFLLSSSFFWIKHLFFKYDIVIGICPPLQIFLYPFLYKLFHRSSTFHLHVQDLPVDAAKNLGLIKSKFLLKLLFKVEQILYKTPTIVSSISDGMKENILKKGIKESNYFSLPNWVDTDHIKPLPEELSLKNSWGFKPQDKIILYSGNIGEKQGLDILINVARRFEKLNDIKFIIVGSGVGKQRLEQAASALKCRNIFFFPLQPYDNLSQLLATADLHLVLQKKHTSDIVMPSKLTTILAAGGVAIISTDKSSFFYNIISDNNIGILVSPEDEDSLYDAIKNNVYVELDSIKESSRNYAINFLSKNQILKNLQKLIFNIKDNNSKLN